MKVTSSYPAALSFWQVCCAKFDFTVSTCLFYILLMHHHNHASSVFLYLYYRQELDISRMLGREHNKVSPKKVYSLEQLIA